MGSEVEIENTISRVSSAGAVHIHLKTYLILLVCYCHSLIDSATLLTPL